MNLVSQNLLNFGPNCYLRKADPAADYWFDFALRKLRQLQEQFGDQIFLIVHGSPENDDDFFVIPFPVVKEAFVEETLVVAKEGDARRRWVGNIINKQLRISRHDKTFDLSSYYGNRLLLEKLLGVGDSRLDEEVDSITMHMADKLDQIAERFRSDAEAASLYVEDESPLRLLSCLLSKRFLIATGLAGSGKTKLAQAIARWMTPVSESSDPFVPGARIQSGRIAYVVKDSDSLSVEMWNSGDETEAIKVVMPREMIQEWATYIETHNIDSKETTAREIREAVAPLSKFSPQLHSFETHLKAAAFALIKAQGEASPAKCYAVVPVGADWTGNENILGYPDGLQPPKLKGDGTVEGPGAYVSTPTLDLILHAIDHPNTPHFLILDEMNLSHVERYFADMLSAIESDDVIQLHADADRRANWKPVPNSLRLPKNLFIIGTVNVDETTYMFSPKVLDRANVIEFRVSADDMREFLGEVTTPDIPSLAGKGATYGSAFVQAANSNAEVPAEVKTEFDDEMLLFFTALQSHGAEFGYRTANEARRFVHFFKELGGDERRGNGWFDGAFDCVVLQKFLPKLHGSRVRLSPLLKKLWFLCTTSKSERSRDIVEAMDEAARATDKDSEPAAEVPSNSPYPRSAEKLARMWRLLVENGFTSFAEA